MTRENVCESAKSAANEPCGLPVDENAVGTWPKSPVVWPAQRRAVGMEYAARRMTGDEPDCTLAEYLRDVSAVEREYALSRAKMAMDDCGAFHQPRNKFAFAYIGCVWFAIAGEAERAELARERVNALIGIYGLGYGGAEYARACGFIIAALSQGERV